jgi:CIC family chloride channel protein
VCELAGNYDLLVPLMLALGISIISIRKVSLYDSQVATQTESPVHRHAFLLDVLQGVHVRDVLPLPREFRTFQRDTPASDMLITQAETDWQDVFPVLDAGDALVGLVTAGSLRVVAVEHEGVAWLLAADLMQPPVSVTLDTDLRTASARLLANTLREVPVTDSSGKILALLDEMDIAQWHINASANASKTPLPVSRSRWEIPSKA